MSLPGMAAAGEVPRRHVLWQLPTVATTLFVAVGIAVARPEWLGTPAVLGGLVLVGLATGLAVLLDRVSMGPAASLAVPLLDIAAVSLVRAEVLPEVTTIGLLLAFPIMWLAFEFGRLGMALAVAGAAFASSLPFFLDSAVPEDGVAWLQLLILPFVAIYLAFAVRILAGIIRRGQAALLERSAALAEALRTAEDATVLRDGILQTIPAGVSFHDADGTLRMSNGLVHELARKSRADDTLAGRDVWYPDQRTRVPADEQPLPRALRGEPIDGELVWVGPPGDQVATLCSARQLRREDGELVGTVTVAWDVTELMELSKLREDFLATVSHELRTPLTSILGYAELLDDTLTTASLDGAGPLDVDRAREVVGIVQRNADTLLVRISQLLSASERDIAVEAEETDLGVLVENAVVRHLPAASSAGVHVEQVRAPNVRAPVDPMRFEQVIDNLLSNAIKYTPEGGIVSVELDRDVSDHVVLTVADTGIGMSPSEQRQAFEKFYRADSARRSATQGIGVGLAIVNEVVDAHRGQVVLDSRPGAGTTVRVVLPAA